jgi:hypothetical protein
VSRRALLVAALASVTCTAPLAAQGSAFALRGLGISGRGVTGRTAGTLGAFAPFDPLMATNPAAVARVRSVTGWATGAPTSRSYQGPLVQADLQTTRFPLFGFATSLPGALSLGVTISDYLDRTWQVQRIDSQLVQGAWERYIEAGKSLGGVTDFAFNVGYRAARGRLLLGGSFHGYIGSVRLTAQRDFEDGDYIDIVEQGTTDFRGFGMGAGLLYAGRRTELALSGRISGDLRSENTTGTYTDTPLPWELSGGIRFQLVRGVLVAASVEYAAWSRAEASLQASGEEGARDVLAAAVGMEAQNLRLGPMRTPLRLGYRVKQQPFPSLGSDLDESAWGGGIGFNFSRERATVDIAYEHGSRSAGDATESFQTIFLGLTIRP